MMVAADRDGVFRYLTQVENLPRWAPLLCGQLWRDGQRWLATTPGGQDYVAISSEPRTGVIDLLMGIRPDEMALLALRVVRQVSKTVVICTFIQPSGWSGDVADRYHDALLAGLRGLPARLGGGEVAEITPDAGRFHPSVVTARFHETWDFYTTHLGFRTTCENGMYVHLTHPNGAQLGLLREELDGLPAELVSAANGRGFWLSVDVADADAEYVRLCAAGVDIAEPIDDKPWGQRQFLVRDPNGILIAIAHRMAAPIEGMACLPAAS